jgi:hypothetical protein
MSGPGTTSTLARGHFVYLQENLAVEQIDERNYQQAHTAHKNEILQLIFRLM